SSYAEVQRLSQQIGSSNPSTNLHNQKLKGKVGESSSSLSKADLTFVKEGYSIDSKKGKPNSPNAQHKNSGKNFVPVCHYCGIHGHIRPKCYRIHNDIYTGQINDWSPCGVPLKAPKLKDIVNHEQKNIWVPKESKNVCLSSILALKSTSNSDWYFDSGCSCHMTGLRSNLTNIMHVSSSSVTFGDGAKNKVLGVGCLNVP
ncbi:Zinc knuckle (CCHC-type) family protein, partial [Striga hermonthica]